MAPERRQQSAAAVARRAERLQAKREVVLRATLDIINEGDTNPSMPKIVERSGIPERSIFRYFDDIADLTTQAIAFARVDLSDLIGLQQVGEGSLDERIESMVDARLRVLERVRYLSRIARMRVFLAPGLAVILDELLEALSAEITEHFATELTALSDADAALTVDSLTTLLAFESYDLLRRRLDRSIDDIAATWRLALKRQLS